VIIGVGEGYREDGAVAILLGCAEVAGVVENLWNACFAVGLWGFSGGGCGNLLFHVERFGRGEDGVTVIKKDKG
jgi:hypothetical protein